MHISNLIKSTESLIQLISKCRATISKKTVRRKAEKWVAEYRSDLFKILASYPKTIKCLKYLTGTANNQRLIKKKWLRNLRIILKDLKIQQLNSGRQQVKITKYQKNYIFPDPLLSKLKKER